MDALPHAAPRKRRNIINVCGKKMLWSACAKGTFAFRPICITPSGTLTGSSAWLLRESARTLAKDGRGGRGSRGRILGRVGGRGGGVEGRVGGGVEIGFLCGKAGERGEGARALAPVLAPGELVLSMQSGVDNVEQIGAAAAIDALPAVVYVAASVPEPGRVKHVGRGDLVVGPRSEKTERVAALFSRANVPCRISENIEGELWTKLVWNCALNAISALGHAKYGQITASADAWKVVETV